MTRDQKVEFIAKALWADYRVRMGHVPKPFTYSRTDFILRAAATLKQMEEVGDA